MADFEQKNDGITSYLIISKMADRTPRMILYPGKEMIAYLGGLAEAGNKQAFSQLLAYMRYLHPATTMQEADLKAQLFDAVLRSMDNFKDKKEMAA